MSDRENRPPQDTDEYLAEVRQRLAQRRADEAKRQEARVPRRTRNALIGVIVVLSVVVAVLALFLNQVTSGARTTRVPSGPTDVSGANEPVDGDSFSATCKDEVRAALEAPDTATFAEQENPPFGVPLRVGNDWLLLTSVEIEDGPGSRSRSLWMCLADTKNDGFYLSQGNSIEEILSGYTLSPIE